MSFREGVLFPLVLSSALGCGGRVHDDETKLVDGATGATEDGEAQDASRDTETDIGGTACDACAETKCKPALEACRSNSGCIKRTACVEKCSGDTACLGRCTADFPSANYDLLANCLAGRCGC